MRSVAEVLGQPFDRLWGKTMLCGTVGAPRAPACFNGSPYVPIPIATGVDPQRALTLMEQPEEFPGIGVRPEPARSYPAPAGANAAHLLGWVARPGAADLEAAGGAIDAEDVIGRSGLEQQYDGAAARRNGATVVAIDPRGVVTDTLSSRAPVPGSDVVTHLDARLQAAHRGRARADRGASARRRAARRLRRGCRPRRHERRRRRGGQQPGIRPGRLHRGHQRGRARRG